MKFQFQTGKWKEKKIQFSIFHEHIFSPSYVSTNSTLHQLSSSHYTTYPSPFFNNTMFKQILRRWYSPINYNRVARPKRFRKVDPFQNQNQNQNQNQVYNDTTTLYDNYGNANYNTQPSTSYNPSTSSLITPTHPAFPLLSQSTLIIERRIEYMNLFLGFEQANQYAIYNTSNEQIGWIIERDFGLSKMILRQIYRLHRPFIVDVLDMNGNLMLSIKRPFSFINSHIKAMIPYTDQLLRGHQDAEVNVDKDGLVVVGESVQNWHLWRRKYNLFNFDFQNGNYNQFGVIDSGFLSWDFPIYDQDNAVFSSVSRNFNGLFREAFTDTGVYVLRMDPLDNELSNGNSGNYNVVEPLTLDEKAVVLANAVSIDFDYFSRHSGMGGGGLFIFGGGGGDGI